MQRARYSSLGLRFDVLASSDRLLELADRFLPPRCLRVAAGIPRATFAVHAAGACPCGRAHEGYTVYRGRSRAGVWASESDAMQGLRAEVKMFVATYSKTFVFVHAGAVAWNGRAVVVPGASGSGKSTLIRELVRAGAVYYSDDMVLLDRAGLVHAYPLPFGQRARMPDFSFHPYQADLDPARIGAAIGTTPVPVGLVIDTRFVPGARFRPTRVSSGAAAMRLLANCVQGRRRPEACLGAVAAAATSGSCWSGPRQDAADVVPFVTRMLDVLDAG